MDHIKNCRESRTVVIPDCKEKNPDDCTRSFNLFFPSILCGGDGRNRIRRGLQSNDDPASNDGGDKNEEPLSLESIGTLPLVFGIHCFGCTAVSIEAFVEHANTHNMVLVLPQGLQNSFNAQHCCGYALENEVDDVGFLQYVQSSLSEEYSFLHADYTYGVGWSNGGE